MRRLAGLADEIEADLERIGGASSGEQRERRRRLDEAARQSEAIGMRLASS